MKHTKLIPQVRCIHPGCNRQMWYMHSHNGTDVYRCSENHIRKMPRVPSSGTIAPPDNAA